MHLRKYLKSTKMKVSEAAIVLDVTSTTLYQLVKRKRDSFGSETIKIVRNSNGAVKVNELYRFVKKADIDNNMSIDEYLLKTDKTLAAFYKALKFSRQTVCEWKNGNSIPSRLSLKKIYLATQGNVTPASFFAELIK